MKMSEHSRPPASRPISDDCPASSSVARHARTPASPMPPAAVSTASEQAFSSRRSALSESADQFGDALRTCRASEIEVLSGLSMGWKRSATLYGRWWWEAVTSAHQPSASGCGCSSWLPRPAKRDHKDVSSTGVAYAAAQARHQPSLATRAYLAGHSGHDLPTIYAWVMGFPANWFARLLPPTETPSYPKS